MKRFAIAALLGLAACASNPPATVEPGWITSLADAKQQASGSSRVILADFTGSDWCVYCKKLEEEVFRTKEFKDWAANKVVLLEVDYPRHLSQPSDVRKQNSELLKKFNIKAYPVVIFLDSNGKELGRVGYVEGGPSKWIPQAESAMKGAGAETKAGG